MSRFKGYKTLIGNGVALIVALGAFTGVIIPESDQTALVAGLIAAFNIVNRFFTTTAVGKAE